MSPSVRKQVDRESHPEERWNIEKMLIKLPLFLQFYRVCHCPNNVGLGKILVNPPKAIKSASHVLSESRLQTVSSIDRIYNSIWKLGDFTPHHLPSLSLPQQFCVSIYSVCMFFMQNSCKWMCVRKALCKLWCIKLNYISASPQP